MENGRGTEFKTTREAMDFYIEHREDKSLEGHRTRSVLKRLKIGEYA